MNTIYMKCNEENDDVMLEVVAQPPYRPTELFFQPGSIGNNLSTSFEVVVWTAYTLPSPNPTLWEYTGYVVVVIVEQSCQIEPILLLSVAVYNQRLSNQATYLAQTSCTPLLEDSLVVNPDPSPPSLHFAVFLPSLSEVLPAHPCWAQDSANVNRIKRDGITKLVVLPLYPQFSISTSGSSLRLLESIFREDEYLVNMQHTVIPSWYQREGYIKAMADLMEKELKSFERPKEVMLFFSAHGVPLAYVEEAGDPYKAEMEECVDLIMEELEKRRVHNAYTLAYQVPLQIC
ncbi:hypothetical protein FXO38_16230 [Capsicum annuum]|nr:hypothetical protein FXO38_16230 [Capsicum annuum]KAF3654180.1 hypothetical protein FXO37_16619 [Capsicum annuum]